MSQSVVIAIEKLFKRNTHRLTSWSRLWHLVIAFDVNDLSPDGYIAVSHICYVNMSFCFAVWHKQLVSLDTYGYCNDSAWHRIQFLILLRILPEIREPHILSKCPISPQTRSEVVFHRDTRLF